MTNPLTTKIVDVREIHMPCDQGILYSVEVTLDCGHKTKPNPTFSYRVGEHYRCFACEHPVADNLSSWMSPEIFTVIREGEQS